MNILLTTDWHITDRPEDEYRWKIFDHMMAWIKQQNKGQVPVIYVLGDIVDRKDRHSGALVNRMIEEFQRLLNENVSIWILMGNHDKPINGVPFWSFIEHLRPGSDLQSGISFITKPYANKELVLLPYSDNPSSNWDGIDFKLYRAAFMHQTVTGAIGNNGFELEAPKMVQFPRALKVYSGDIHTTQVVRNVTYIGAPHPVAFGDDYPCQMLELDDDYNIARKIKINALQKLMLRINDPADLKKLELRRGDYARVVCTLALADVDKWPTMQDAIIAWAAKEEVVLFSVEPDIQGLPRIEDNTELAQAEVTDPEYILRLFADAEEIDDRMFQVGVELLKEVL